MRRCVVCGVRHVHARGRCMTDYQFRRRHSRDRTHEEIVRANRRVFDKKLAIGR